MLWHAAVLGVVKGTTTTRSAQWHVAHMHALHHVGSLCNSHVHYLHTRGGFFTPGGFRLQTHLENYKGVNFRAQFKLMKCNLEFYSLKRGLKHKGEKLRAGCWWEVFHLVNQMQNGQPRVKGRHWQQLCKTQGTPLKGQPICIQTQHANLGNSREIMRNIEEQRNYGGGGSPIYTKIFSGLVVVGINNYFYCCVKTWTTMGLLHTCLGNKLLTWDNGSCPHPPISWASSEQQQVKLWSLSWSS